MDLATKALLAFAASFLATLALTRPRELRSNSRDKDPTSYRNLAREYGLIESLGIFPSTRKPHRAVLMGARWPKKFKEMWDEKYHKIQPSMRLHKKFTLDLFRHKRVPFVERHGGLYYKQDFYPWLSTYRKYTPYDVYLYITLDEPTAERRMRADEYKDYDLSYRRRKKIYESIVGRPCDEVEDKLLRRGVSVSDVYNMRCLSPKDIDEYLIRSHRKPIWYEGDTHARRARIAARYALELDHEPDFPPPPVTRYIVNLFGKRMNLSDQELVNLGLTHRSLGLTKAEWRQYLSEYYPSPFRMFAGYEAKKLGYRGQMNLDFPVDYLHFLKRAKDRGELWMLMKERSIDLPRQDPVKYKLHELEHLLEKDDLSRKSVVDVFRRAMGKFEEKVLEQYRIDQSPLYAFDARLTPKSPQLTMLISKLDLRNEGKEMRHCVSEYDVHVAEGSIILSVRSPQGRSTAFLVPDEKGNFYLKEHRGHANSDPPPANEAMVEEYLREINS